MSNLIGRRLAGWRRARGLTQMKVARRANLPQAAISGIENGRRDLSIRTLFRLARALEVTPGTLLDSEPSRPSLDHRAADEVARAVVSGDRKLPPSLRRLADACAAAMRPTLEACGVPGRSLARRRGPRAWHMAEQKFGSEAVKLVLQRIDRHASAWVR